MSLYLDFQTDGADWPNREASCFVKAAGMRWHVQVMGKGPALLLLHGTGSSSHSWRDVMPLLATRYTVVAPDLPGHAFTNPAPGGSLSLPGMAGAIALLLRAMGIAPVFAAGHSAGAAVLVRMTVERLLNPAALLSFNGAFFPVSGVAGQFFSPIAKAVAGISMLQSLFARMADRRSVERLLRDTGSSIDERGLALYQRLFSNQGHVAGTLGMMAAWDLRGMAQDLHNLRVPVFLVRSAGDRTIAPVLAEKAASLVPSATLLDMPGGHLAHEEHPALAATLVTSAQTASLQPGGLPLAAN